MIELPYPAKVLWPNGRGHWAARNRAFQKHKGWATIATAGTVGKLSLPATARIQLSATFYPKTRHKVDHDNASASLKAYVDGIALGIGVDDSRFDAPRIQFGEPVKHGKVVIVLEAA